MFTQLELQTIFYRIIPELLEKTKNSNSGMINFFKNNGGIFRFQNECINELKSNDNQILKKMFPLYQKLNIILNEYDALKRTVIIYYLFHESEHLPLLPCFYLIFPNRLVKQPEVFNYVVNYIDKFNLLYRIRTSELMNANNIYFIQYAYKNILNDKTLFNVNEQVELNGNWLNPNVSKVRTIGEGLIYQTNKAIENPSFAYDVLFLYGKGKFSTIDFPVLLTFKRKTSTAPVNPSGVTNDDPGFTLDPNFDPSGKPKTVLDEPEKNIFPLLLAGLGVWLWFK